MCCQIGLDNVRIFFSSADYLSTSLVIASFSLVKYYWALVVASCMSFLLIIFMHSFSKDHVEQHHIFHLEQEFLLNLMGPCISLLKELIFLRFSRSCKGLVYAYSCSYSVCYSARLLATYTWSMANQIVPNSWQTLRWYSFNSILISVPLWIKCRNLDCSREQQPNMLFLSQFIKFCVVYN